MNLAECQVELLSSYEYVTSEVVADVIAEVEAAAAGKLDMMTARLSEGDREPTLNRRRPLRQRKRSYLGVVFDFNSVVDKNEHLGHGMAGIVEPDGEWLAVRP